MQRDSDTLDRTAGAIRGRSLRVCEVVDGDMQLHEPDAYTDRVRQATRVLREDGWLIVLVMRRQTLNTHISPTCF